MSWVGIAILLAAAACRPPSPAAAPPTPAAAPSNPAAAPPSPAGSAGATGPAQSPGELVKFSGDDSAISNPFHLDVASGVDISWQYAGSGRFALWLVNDTEDLADPNLFRILIKEGEGTSNETVQYRLDPGDYHLEVEWADGPWTVLAVAQQ